jgi:hypothetical protein
LRRSSYGLIESVRQAWLAADENVVLVIEQFEELIQSRTTSFASRADSEEFVRLLLSAAEEHHRLYVVVVMRSDYLGRCSEFPGLTEVLNRGIYSVPQMARSQLEDAISDPAAMGGSTVTPYLTQTLLNEKSNASDQLAALQYVLKRMWDISAPNRAKGEPIDVTHYEIAGKISRALSRQADEVLDSVNGQNNVPAGAVRKMFQMLTEHVDGKGETSRPTTVKTLRGVVGVDLAVIGEIIDAFRTEKCGLLKPPPCIPLTDNTVIEISHESLIRLWDKLQGWIREEVESAVVYRRLAGAARRDTYDNGALYEDPELSDALMWQRQAEWTEAWAERYGGDFQRTIGFLRESELARDRCLAKSLRRQQLIKLLTAFAYVLAGAVLGMILTFAWQLSRL